MSENNLLKPALDLEICNQVRIANNFTPRHVVLARVVEAVCDYINLPVLSLPDYRNMIHLNTELKTRMEDYWHTQSQHNSSQTSTNGNGTSGDNQEELEKMLAKDYHKPADIVRFIGFLLRRESKQGSVSTIHKLYEILAADGYLGDDMKRYVEYLKYTTPNDFKSEHVNAVRQFYDRGLCTTPQEMYHVLQMAFGHAVPKEDKDSELKDLYVFVVGDKFDAICEWKMHQSQDELKRKESGSVKKRKLDPSQDSKPEKPAKRARKNKTPVKVQQPEPEDPQVSNSNLDSSSSSSESEPEELEG